MTPRPSLLACLLLLLTVPATAQTPKPVAPAVRPTPPAATTSKPPEVDSEPQTTTATFGDWVLRCQRAAEGQQPRRTCELVQSIQVRGQNAPIAEIAFGRPAANGPLHVTAVVPTNVAFPTAVRIAMEENDSQPLNLMWMRCLPGGCFADATPNEELVKRWRVHQEPGRIMFKDGANRDVTLPISFQGLGPALDALAKEP